MEVIFFWCWAGKDCNKLGLSFLLKNVFFDSAKSLFIPLSFLMSLLSMLWLSPILNWGELR